MAVLVEYSFVNNSVGILFFGIRAKNRIICACKHNHWKKGTALFQQTPKEISVDVTVLVFQNCPHSPGLKLKLVLTKPDVHVHSLPLSFSLRAIKCLYSEKALQSFLPSFLKTKSSFKNKSSSVDRKKHCGTKRVNLVKVITYECLPPALSGCF